MTRIGSRFKLVTCILTALAGTAVPSLAVTSISTCPASNIVNITVPGNYQLTANLNNCTVAISASNVSLSLNGFTITAPFNLDGIDVNFVPGVGFGAGRLNRVGIQGPGLIESSAPGGNSGIYIVGTDYSQIDLVTIKYGFGDGISDLTGAANTYLTIGSNVISGAGAGLGYGILMYQGCISCTITGNDVSGNNSAGIWLNQGSANNVTNNTANANGAYGILLSGETATRVSGNVTDGNQQAGIVVFGTSVEVFSNTSSRANKIFDLYDNTSNCSGDLWSGNVFQTSNQSCID